MSGQRHAATVRFDHVSKQYDPAQIKKGAPGAVNDLSFEVPAGKICVLVGPSGCGKTTTLKMVNRLIEPTSGHILVDGVDIATRDVTDLRRSIGYVIQQVGLFPHQTIEENVGTVTRLLGWPAARRRERSRELLAIVGLDPVKYGRRFPSQLSGGERQRVGVARALAADPPIMLMDEPFGAVDPIVRERLQNEFLRLQEDLAKTILFVTHDIDEAIKMGDLVAVLQVGGKMAQFGTPEEILSNPADDFVARFVGTDRGLKLLSLHRIGDLPLTPFPVVEVGSSCAAARNDAAGHPFAYVMLVDQARRPIGWVADRSIPADGAMREEMAIPMPPRLNRRSTLKDALSLLLHAAVQAGVVVDRNDALVGVVTVDEIAGWMRRPSDERDRDRDGSTNGHQRIDEAVEAAGGDDDVAPDDRPSDLDAGGTDGPAEPAEPADPRAAEPEPAARS